MNPPKRSLRELVFLLRQEPTLFDIFVEGVSDAGFIRWFLESQGRPSPVYPIDSIDVPRAVVEKWGLTPNNRNEVIALCAELQSLGVNQSQACGIVDRDFSDFIEEPMLTTLIIVTDYTSLDMYFWSEAHVAKFLRLSFPTVVLVAHQVWANLALIAQEVFLIHLVIREISLGRYQWVNTSKFLASSNKQLEFKQEALLRELLRRNLMPCEFAEFVQKIEERRAKLTNEPRLQMHHDELAAGLHYLLAAEVSKPHDKERCRPEAITPTLRCSCEHGTLSRFPMFRELLNRLPSP